MWLADVADLPGAHAYASTLGELRNELTDAVILAADPNDDAHVDITFSFFESRTGSVGAVVENQ